MSNYKCLFYMLILHHLYVSSAKECHSIVLLHWKTKVNLYFRKSILKEAQVSFFSLCLLKCQQ